MKRTHGPATAKDFKAGERKNAVKGEQIAQFGLKMEVNCNTAGGVRASCRKWPILRVDDGCETAKKSGADTTTVLSSRKSAQVRISRNAPSLHFCA